MTQQHPQHIIDRILLLHRENRTASTIGADVGLSRNAIIGIIHRQRVKAGATWSGPMSKAKSPSVQRPKSVVIDKLMSHAKRGAVSSSLFNEQVVAAPVVHEQVVIDWKHPPRDNAVYANKPVSILDVKECRAPVTKRVGVHMFCNTTRKPGSSYCVDHHALYNFPPRAVGARR